MKKTILMLAGIAVLASCAKEIAPDVYEQAPAAATGKFTIVADRGGDTNTKVAYDPTEAILKDRSTWEGYENLGIFTYGETYNSTDKKTTITWTNYPDPDNANIANPFKTSLLFKGKTSAAFTGDLKAFEGYIYGVYPEADMPTDDEGEAITKITGDAGTDKASALKKAKEKAAKDLVLTFEYKEGSVVDVEGTDTDVDYVFGSAAVEGVKGEKYLKNLNDANNIVLLFRSENEKFKLTTTDYEGNDALTTSLPSLTAKYLSSRIHLTIHKEKNDDTDMNDEWAILKSVKITALDDKGDEIPAFHKEMKINLLDFDEIYNLSSINDNSLDVLYKNAEADSKVKSLEFGIQCPDEVTEETEATEFYKLAAEESVVLPLIIFPTEKFEYIRCEVTWINNAYQEQVTETRLEWGTVSARRLVGDVKKWTVNLPISDATEIKENGDVRELVQQALEKGKTHIVLGDDLSKKLYDQSLPSETYREKFDTDKAALLIPKAASDKNIVIEGYLRDNEDDTFTIAFADDYTCGENGSVTFIMKNTAELTNTTVILEDPKGSIVLTGEKKYKEVKVKEVKEFTLAGKAKTLSLDKKVKADAIAIAGTVDTITEYETGFTPAIKKIVIAKEGKVPTVYAQNVPAVVINGNVEGVLKVYPTAGHGTDVTVGETAKIGSIKTEPTSTGKSYAKFEINGELTTETNNTLDTQNAPFVEINGDLSNVDVTVNATAEGTEVKIGAGAQVKSLATNKTGSNIFKSFTIDGKVGGDALDTMGAATVTIGSLTKDEYTAASPAIVEVTYANVPALKTKGAETVTIGYKATVKSLNPDTATEITIYGKISEKGLVSDKVEKFVLGEDGTITGSNGYDELLLQPAKGKGQNVTLNGTLTSISRIAVANMTEKFTAKKSASAEKYEVFDVPTVEIAIADNTNSMDFYRCGTKVDIDASGVAANGNIPSINFFNSAGASVTLTGNADGTTGTSTIEGVKNITLVNGKFNDLTLKASEKIEIQGTETNHNTFNDKLSLTAKDIEISQYTVFGGQAEKNVTISATGDVTIGGDSVQMDMNGKQTLVMKKAGSFNMTNVKVGKIENYGEVTLKNCEITGTDTEENKLLAFMWDYTYSNDTTLEGINDVVYNLIYDKDHANLASKNGLINFFCNPGYLDPEDNTSESRATKALIYYTSINSFYELKYNNL